jgi:hypothetical protein
MFLGYNFSIMLKDWRIWVFGILIAAIGIVTVYDQLHYAQTKSYGIECIHNGSPAGGSDTLTCTANNAENTQPRQSEPPRWHVFFAWPEGITALLLLCTLIGILWQARAAADAAKAAKIQAEHTVASERAWIVVNVLNFPESVEEQGVMWISVPMKNAGQTPAIVTKIVATTKLVPSPGRASGAPGKLPEVPDYSNDGRLIKLEGRDILIAPNDSDIGLQVPIWPSEYGPIKAKETFLYVYGFIEYRDTLVGRSHTTKFCSLYWIPERARGSLEPTGFTFSAIIPPAYISAT